MRSRRSNTRLAVAGYVLIAVAILGGCGTVEPEPVAPAPRMMAFTEDPFDETGIRPDATAGDADDPSSGGIIVEWRRLTTQQLGSIAIGGYNLYRADSTDPSGRPGVFHRIASIAELDADDDTSYVDTAVTENVRYWYAVRAIARYSGTEGAWSDTVHFSLTARPIPIWPIGAIDSARAATLKFQFGPSLVAGEVAIRLDRVHRDNESVVLDTVWRARMFSTFADPEVVYGGPALIPNEHYRWRVDKVFGNQPVGNASRWVSFVAP